VCSDTLAESDAQQAALRASYSALAASVNSQ